MVSTSATAICYACRVKDAQSDSYSLTHSAVRLLSGEGRLEESIEQLINIQVKKCFDVLRDNPGKILLGMKQVLQLFEIDSQYACEALTGMRDMVSSSSVIVALRVSISHSLDKVRLERRWCHFLQLDASITPPQSSNQRPCSIERECLWVMNFGKQRLDNVQARKSVGRLYGKMAASARLVCAHVIQQKRKQALQVPFHYSVISCDLNGHTCALF